MRLYYVLGTMVRSENIQWTWPCPSWVDIIVVYIVARKYSKKNNYMKNGAGRGENMCTWSISQGLISSGGPWMPSLKKWHTTSGRRMKELSRSEGAMIPTEKNGTKCKGLKVPMSTANWQNKKSPTSMKEKEEMTWINLERIWSGQSPHHLPRIPRLWVDIFTVAFFFFQWRLEENISAFASLLVCCRNFLWVFF